MPMGGFDLNLSNPLVYGETTSTSRGTTVTGSSTANSKGSWVAIANPLSADMGWVLIILDGSSFAAAGYALVDIGITATSANSGQTTLISNLILEANDGEARSYGPMPLAIPNGYYVWARCQTNSASNSLYVSMIGFEASPGFDTYSCWDTYGVVSSGASYGTALTSSGTADTKGSYVTIASSLNDDTCGLVFSFDGQNSANINACGILLDVAIGTSNTNIISNMPISSLGGNTNPPYDDMYPGHSGFLPFYLAKGTKVSARIQDSVGGGKMGFAMYGLRA